MANSVSAAAGVLPVAPSAAGLPERLDAGHVLLPVHPLTAAGPLSGFLETPAIVLAAPRFVMVLLWIFTGYLSRAYDGWALPLIGFFVLPTCTLAYAIAQNETGGLRSWGILLVAIAGLIDLGIWGGGRGVFARK